MDEREQKMRKLAKILAGVALVVVAVLAYLILGSGLNVSIDTRIFPAGEYREEYVSLTGSEQGMQERSIVCITVEAKNKGFIPAEWTELHFSTLDGDVLAYNVEDGPADIPAFGSATFTVNLITENADSRGVWLSYYLAGRERIAE